MLRKLNVKAVVEEVSVIPDLFKDLAVKIGKERTVVFFVLLAR
jgi:hypothetical protein